MAVFTAILVVLTSSGGIYRLIVHITSGSIYCHFSQVMINAAVFTAAIELA